METISFHVAGVASVLSPYQGCVLLYNSLQGVVGLLHVGPGLVALCQQPWIQHVLC